MKITCQNCENKYNIKDEKIPNKNFKIKCPNCKEYIHVSIEAPQNQDKKINDSKKIEHEKSNISKTKNDKKPPKKKVIIRSPLLRIAIGVVIGSVLVFLAIVALLFYSTLVSEEQEVNPKVSSQYESKVKANLNTEEKEANSKISDQYKNKVKTNQITEEKAVNSNVSGQYKIKVKANSTGPTTVDIEIETNIPGNFNLAASLSLKGLKPDDTFIGTAFMRVPVSIGKAKCTIDGNEKNRVRPHGSKLPKGEYDVEVSFHPRWKENQKAAKAANISDTIEGKTSVLLLASGQSTSSAKALHDGQRWVMENFYMGYPWKPEFWRKKFGPLQQVKYHGSGNSDILKMYYIKSINMTLLVNALKKEIITYRKGLAHE